MSGAAAPRSRNAPWTCTSGGCARRSSRPARRRWSRPSAGRATASARRRPEPAVPARIRGMDWILATAIAALAAACAVLAWLWRRLRRLESERLEERRRARAGRRRLLDLLRAYRALADALPDAVIVAERNSQRIVWFNPAATRLLGLRQPRDIDAPL